MKKRIFAVLMAICLMTPATVFAQPEGENTQDESKEIVIYHTNDTHGYLAGGETVVGIDKVAGLKASTPNSILVDAGDATQGLPLASLTKGADVISLMNLAGYDLMTAGNHEFDFGTEQFLSNAALAKFPILAANVYRNGAPLLSGVPENNTGCHTVIERDGVKIGFFGLTTVDTRTSTNPTGIADLEFKEEVETAQAEIDELEAAGVDAIVAVCHMGKNAGVSCNSNELAQAMTGKYQGKIDVIIDGHSHEKINEEENEILIVQNEGNMAEVGKLTLEISKEGVIPTETKLSPADVASVEPVSAVSEKLAEIQKSQESLLNEKVGAAETTLWAGLLGNGVAIARIVETNYGDLVADAFRDAGETFMKETGGPDAQLPVIAVENAGGIRAGASNGDITKGDLIEAFPYSNTLYIKKVTPVVLYEVMELSGVMLDGQDKETGMLLQGNNSGGFLQISGFTVVYNPDAEEGSRVTSITLDGQTSPLKRDDTATEIMMVSNNYIMDGGSDYSMLGELPKYGEAGGELETIQSYLESCLDNGVLQGYAGTKKRILMRAPGYEPKDYTASILITDKSGAPAVNQELSYCVDGGASQSGTTDENGMLQITLTDGAHGVRLADEQQEVYIDNYSGFGIYVDQYRTQATLIFSKEGGLDPTPGEDEKEPQDNSGQEKPDTRPSGEAPDDVEVVQTGDSTSLTLWLVLALAGGACAAGVLHRGQFLK